MGRVVRGAARGAESTIQGLASPIRRAFGMPPAVPPPEEDTTAGALGRGAERAGEFFIPEALAGKLWGSARLAARARALFGAGKLADYAAPVVKGLTSGAGTAALTEAQGGTGTQAGVAGAVAAASPVVGQAITALGPGLRTAAGRAVAKALGDSDIAKPEVRRAVASAVPVALDEGIQSTWAKWIRQTGASKEKIGQSIQHILSEEQTALNAGRPVEAALGNEPVSTRSLIDGLETYKQKVAQNVMNAQQTAAQVGGAAAGQQLASGTITYNQRMVKVISEMQSTLAAHGDVIPLRNVMRLKQDWDQYLPYIADGSGGLRGSAKLALRAKAYKAGADLIRDELESNHPTVDAIDKAYSAHARLYGLLYKAATGTEMPDLVQQGTKLAVKAGAHGLTGAIGGALAGSGAATELGGQHQTRNTLAGTVIGAGVGALLQRSFDSPAWQTFPAAQKLALSRAIASGDVEKIRRIITPILALNAAADVGPAAPAAIGPPAPSGPGR